MLRVATAVLLAASVTGAAAQQRAQFLAGTYATEEGCAELDRIATGTPPGATTTPRTLDPKGFHGWEGGCEFTQIIEHKPGQVWVALMFCSEGAATGPATYSFVKNEDGTFDVSTGLLYPPEVYQLCGKHGN
jgi:hypothetical protein